MKISSTSCQPRKCLHLVVSQYIFEHGNFDFDVTFCKKTITQVSSLFCLVLDLVKQAAWDLRNQRWIGTRSLAQRP